MAVVKVLQHGDCKLHFCDDYIKKDEGEIQKILGAIGRLAVGQKEKKEEASA